LQHLIKATATEGAAATNIAVTAATI